DDGSALLHCRWWHAKEWMADYFAVNREFLVFGKPDSLRPRTMDHAELELVEGGEEEFIHLNRLAPIYPLTEGLPQRWLRALVWRTLERHERDLLEPECQVSGVGCQVPEARGRKPGTWHLTPDTFPSRANAVHML